MDTNRQSLRINVGFIVHQEPGFSREIDFNLAQLQLQPDLNLNNFTGRAKLSRTRQGILLEMQASASTPLECARCLDIFDEQLNVQFTELYAFDERSTDEAELTVPEDSRIDLAPLLREYMILEIPIKAICKADCSGLLSEDEKHRTKQHDDDEDIDPRFAALKDLLEDED